MLVTGGAGFIGSNLAKKLAADGHNVVAADAFVSAHFSNLIDFPGDVLTLRDPMDMQSMTASIRPNRLPTCSSRVSTPF